MRAWLAALGLRAKGCPATAAIYRGEDSYYSSDKILSLDCVRKFGHDGRHRDDSGLFWESTIIPVSSDQPW